MSNYNILRALKESIIYYIKNVKYFIILFSPLLLLYIFPYLILRNPALIYYKYSMNIYSIQNLSYIFYDFSKIYFYIFLFLILFLLIYPFPKITTYLFYKNKNLKNSIMEFKKYYLGYIIINITITILQYLGFIIIFTISVFLAIIFSFIFNILNETHIIVIAFLIFSISFLIYNFLINKLFLTSPYYIYDIKNILKSFEKSWDNINIYNSTKIFLGSVLLDIIIIILGILSLIFYNNSLLYVAYIIIANYIISPISTIYKIKIYEQSIKNYL